MELLGRLRRLPGALVRRGRHWLRRLTGRDGRTTPAERAMAFLLAQRPNPDDPASQLVAGMAVASLEAYGLDDAAAGWRHVLTTNSAAPWPILRQNAPWFAARLEEAERLEQAVRSGDLAAAARCLTRWEARQSMAGDFLPAASRRVPDSPGLRAARTAVVSLYLTATLARIAAAFDTQVDTLPGDVAEDDWRLTQLQNILAEADLPAGGVVAEIGCGTGRFLKALSAARPDLRWVGVDVSPAMLARLASPIEAIEGSLLRIPPAVGGVDFAFAVESLEHCLLPEQGIRELLRIVRPGGRIAVIDKLDARRPLSELEPWERWFTVDEVAAWLAIGGTDLRTTFRPDPGRSPLFACWHARRV